MVGSTGLEPVTPTMSTWCANLRLNYKEKQLMADPPKNGGRDRTRTYDPHDVNVVR